MRIGPVIRYIAFYAAFLLCVPMSPAGALTFTGQTKDVNIDADWRISGVYRYDLRITDPADIPQIQHIIRQLNQHPDRFTRLFNEVRRPDGRITAWDLNASESLPTETSVHIAFEVSTAFSGFAELFADYMHVHQDIPVEKVNYRITFPREMAFSYRITQEDQSFQDRRRAVFFAWSAENVSRLDIMVSTAESWEQIAQRYQTHFQKIMGKGLAVTDFPEILANIDGNGSSTEKIHAVMSFLENEMDYRRRRHPDNSLFPDEPITVLHRRWGDCKDISLLGAAMLKAMGIDAFVALAGKPRPHGGREESAPDPFIFDHAIIGVAGNDCATYYDAFMPGKNVIPDDQYIYVHLKVPNDAGQ